MSDNNEMEKTMKLPEDEDDEIEATDDEDNEENEDETVDVPESTE